MYQRKYPTASALCVAQRRREKIAPISRKALVTRLHTVLTLGILPLGATSLSSTAFAEPRIEEVIVTAQKRDRSLRDVPVSLTVFSGEAMQQAGLYDLGDIAGSTPNVSATDESNSLYIRGIGTPELNLVGEQAVSYVLDGVYVPKLAYLAGGFLDVDQLEILKGPQSTLYGRNAIAGVINIRHATPTAEWSARLRVRSGDRGIRYVEGTVSGSMTDNLSVRLAANRASEEGSTNSIPSGATLGDRIQENQRLTLQYSNSSAFDAILRYTRFKYFHGVFLGYEFIAYPNDLRLTLAEPNDPHFETNLDRRSSLPRNKGSRYESRTSGKGRIVPLEVNWKAWGHDFTSISSYAEIDTFLGGDTDYLAAEIVGDESFLDDRQYSQELRVSRDNGRWAYTAALYYFHNQNDVYYEIPLFADFALAAASLGLPRLKDLLSSLSGQGNTVLDKLLVDFDISSEALGIFGEIRWAITNRLRLTLGGRSSRETKEAVISTSNTGPAPIWNAISDAPYKVARNMDDNNFSPKLSLSWDYTENLTLHASYTEGFRGGSYNAGATQTSNLTFEAEKAVNIEAGLKSEFLDKRLRWNLTLFHTDYSDYQLSAFTGVGYVTSNAPKVQMRGLESNISAILLPGLQFQLAAGRNSAQFEEHPNGACPSEPISRQVITDPGSNPLSSRSDCNLSGQPLHRAPRWTGTVSVNYDASLQGLGLPWRFFIGATASYKDAEYFDADLDPIDSERAYWLYNAQAGIRDQRDRWRLTVHGVNLGNELRKTYSGDVSLQPGAHIAATNHPRYTYASFEVRF